MRRVLFAAGLAVALSLAACDRSQSAPAASAPTGEAKAFLDRNAREEGVKTTASGLQYKVVRSGPADGVRPKEGDEVKVHYQGSLIDGTVFDSSYQQGVPAIFEVGQLVDGWNEALQLMKPGDEFLLYVPPNLAYGEEGAGGVIPPNAVLVFRMELLDVLPRGGGVQRG
jgi:peptidylprolyl isomerase/FKBP-type peptidyl-prolyl cis-trans isomerase FklB